MKMANYILLFLAVAALVVGVADDLGDRFGLSDAVGDASTLLKEAMVDSFDTEPAHDVVVEKPDPVGADVVSDASHAVTGALAAALEQTAPERDRACVAEAVAHMLLLEHERRPVRLIQPYVDAAFDAAEDHGVDPYLVVAVGYRESRFRRVLGDDGRSCGPWQYQARYHPDVLDHEEDRDETCDRLMNDPLYGATAAAERLSRFDHVCHYNQGNRCLRRDLDGSPNSYSGRVEATRSVIVERCSL